MSNRYKKYMKKPTSNMGFSLYKLFIISFFGMLLVFTILIKSFSPSVDVSIGDYRQDQDMPEESVNVDGRLAAIQEEDTGRNFADLMKNADDVVRQEEQSDVALYQEPEPEPVKVKSEPVKQQEDQLRTKQEQSKTAIPSQEPVYKVYIGSYTSAEQAKVAKDIIQDLKNGLNPIVKCLGTNNYTLQVGIFKSKTGAEALLYTVKQSNLPGRIAQEY